MTPEFFTISSGRLQLKTTTIGASAAALFYAPHEFSLIKELHPQSYPRHHQHFGAIAGPIANRIAGGRFTLDGKDIVLERNEGETSIHSGRNGLGRQLWQVALHEDDRIIFQIHQADGALGLPGNRQFQCQYRLRHADGEDKLSVELTMTSDQDTVCNMAFHPYFCLDDQGSVLSHYLYLNNADGYLEKDRLNLPTGTIIKPASDELCFNPSKQLAFLAAQIQDVLDHHFCLNPTRDQHQDAAVLYSPISSIKMTVATNQPGLQLYCPKSLDADLKDPDGKGFNPFPALCIEPHKWPDAPRHQHFPSILTKANQTYRNHSVFTFSEAAQL